MSTTAAQAPTRTCPSCGDSMSRSRAAACRTCGWEEGLVPVSRTQDPDGGHWVQFVAEPPLPHASSSLFWLFAGALLITFGAGSENAGDAVAGVALLTLAVVAAWASRFGRRYYPLSRGMRSVVRTGLWTGRLFMWCSIIGLVIGLFGGDWVRRNL